ncbi:MAG: 50S ribosomal protein L31 [Candidatus Sungbacteria bacterium]|uniref:Large ribosomal subunit protein bL31 n=1 Tax=Candidatus Sungiibacteriota bacterium TaxID=2750080 RepID=A0A931SBY5_9BACT|nr:50S ribosomal protein L31 [Candidatus Sungbacteria bacterium]
MKKGIHPTYFTEALITCACGNKIKTGSAKERVEVEICSNCHPFYTGKEKMIDAAGRVEKFRERLKKKRA